MKVILSPKISSLHYKNSKQYDNRNNIRTVFNISLSWNTFYVKLNSKQKNNFAIMFNYYGIWYGKNVLGD